MSHHAYYYHNTGTMLKLTEYGIIGDNWIIPADFQASVS